MRRMEQTSITSQVRAVGSLYEIEAYNIDPQGWDADDRLLDAVEADIALARGRLLYARFLWQGGDPASALPLFTRAADMYRRLADARARLRRYSGAEPSSKLSSRTMTPRCPICIGR